MTQKRKNPTLSQKVKYYSHNTRNMQKAIHTKSQLAIQLSKLKIPEELKPKPEQYITPGEIAAGLAWDALLDGNIKGKTVADLGAGTGVLGIAALMLGAKHVFFVENDPAMLAALKINLSQFTEASCTILKQSINEFKEKPDTILQNPPFGTKSRHADKEFLEKAFQAATSVYTIHKSSTAEFIVGLAHKNSFALIRKRDFDFPIKHQFRFHKKPVKNIQASLFYFRES